MIPTILTLTTLGVYLLATYGFWRRIHTEPAGTHSAKGMELPVLLGCLAAALHLWFLANGMLGDSSLNLALGYVFSLVSLMTVLVYLSAVATGNVINLGLFVMPVGFFGLLIGRFFTGEDLPVTDVPMLQWWHLGIALLAFGFLCIAAAQAFLLYIQDRHLHSHRPGSLLPALPPIQTMERNLFRLTLIGFVLLTLNLVIGMGFQYAQEGRTLAFNHHVLLSFLAWMGFAALLAGHRIYGWRGAVAARWTLAAFGILVLAFFGTRFVTSIILS